MDTQLTIRVRRLWGLAGLLLLLIVGGSLLVALARGGQSQTGATPTSPSTAVAASLPRPTFTSTALLKSAEPASRPPTATPSPSPTSSPTPTITPTPTLTPTPTPTLPLAQRLAAATQFQAEGQYDRARRLFAELVSEASDPAVVHLARFHLGQSYLADANYEEAAAVMAQVAGLDPDPVRRRQAQFLLGEALAGLGEWERAIASYRAYLTAGGLARSETWERMGQAYRQLEMWERTEDAYAHAIEEAPDVPTALRLREALAQMALGREQPDKALAQYEAILGVARNPGYRAEILYRAGEALRAAGRIAEAIERYQAAADTRPASSYAHQALVALLDLGAPVDEYQRGVINYYNRVYDLAVAALERYVAMDPDARGGQAYDFLARAYHALGLYQEAVVAWDRVIEDFPQCPCWGQAWLQRATTQVALGDTTAARAGLLTFAESYPQHRLAADALTQAARILEDAGDCEAAAREYRNLQARYPSSRQGAEGLFAAGMCMYRQQRPEDAVTDWRRLLNVYPTGGSELLARTRLWLGKALLAAGELTRAADIWHALARQPETYYGQRALTLAQEAGLDLGVPVQAAPPPGLSAQEAAEAWLRSWLPDPSPSPLSTLPPELAQDPSLVRGLELLDLGLTEQALDELNRLRQRYKDDPLALYRLSLLFRDQRVYRLSIACAERLIALSSKPLSEVPLFIQRLAYPTYFADLIETEAAERGIDPLLLYAVVRQESLFETSATSSAAAHGLMQVIPATGEWIAGRLGWSDYRRELLYRPYVSIKFGTYYLWSALQMFEGNVPAALAGYNAGPGNAARWWERANGDDDQFFVGITLSEPRVYIQRIMAYYATYRRLYGAAESGG